MRQRDHEELRADLSAYLLAALEAERAAELERHLEGCEECRAELEWLRPAAQLVPEAVERVEPPPELRRRLLEQVRSESRDRRRAPAPRRRRGRLGLAAGVAATILLAGAAIGYAVRDGSDDGPTRTVAGKAPGVTATLTSDDGAGTLRLANVRPLARSQVLQAWVQRGEVVASAGVLFRPDPDGHAVAVLDDLDGVDAVMVSSEPRGGSEFPTAEPLVSVPVPG